MYSAAQKFILRDECTWTIARSQTTKKATNAPYLSVPCCSLHRMFFMGWGSEHSSFQQLELGGAICLEYFSTELHFAFFFMYDL